MAIDKKAVNVTGDNLLRVIYVRVEDATRWDINPKKHDINGIKASIRRYGFRDAPIWDNTLNNGAGGIVGGNGRSTCLEEMQNAGENVPKGIATDPAGKWCMPIQIGIDAISEAEAIAFAVDHNQLTMMGAGLPYPTMMQIWESDVLKTLSKQMNNLPVSVDAEVLQVLLASEKPPSYEDVVKEYGEPEEEDFWSYIRIKAPPETHNLLHDLMIVLETESELACLQAALNALRENLNGRPS